MNETSRILSTFILGFSALYFFSLQVLQGAVQGGILNRLFNNKSVNICDQFFLGGPLSVRGFDLRGIGNHVDTISLGADVSEHRYSYF